MSLPLGKMWVLGDLYYIGSTLVSHYCGKPDSVIDRNFSLVVGMLGLLVPKLFGTMQPLPMA